MDYCSMTGTLEHWARVDPSRCALLVHASGDRTATRISYAVLDQYSDSVAAALRDLTPNHCTIVIDALSDVNTAYAIFGALKAQRCFVVGTHGATTEDLMQDKSCFALVDAEAARAASQDPTCPRFLIEDLLVRLDHPAPKYTNTNRTAYYQPHDSASSASRLLAVEYDELNSWLIYTSGRFAPSFSGSCFFAAPLSQCTGLYHGLFMPLFCGGQAIRLAAQDAYGSPTQVAQAVIEAKPTLFGGAPTLMEETVEHLAENNSSESMKKVGPENAGNLTGPENLMLCGPRVSLLQHDALKANLARLAFDTAVQNVFVSTTSPAGAYVFGEHNAQDVRIASHQKGYIAQDELYLPRAFITRSAHALIHVAMTDNSAPADATHLPAQRPLGTKDTPSSPAPISRSDATDRIWSIVKSAIVEILENVQPADIKEETKLVDLGANSIDRTEIVIEAMEKLALRIPQTQFAGVKNIGQVVRILAKHLHPSASALSAP